MGHFPAPSYKIERVRSGFPHRRMTSAGFSMVELLMAMGLSVVLLAGGALIFDRLSRQQSQSEVQSKLSRDMERVLSMIQRDIESAVRLNGVTTDISGTISTNLIYGVMPYSWGKDPDAIEGIQIIRADGDQSPSVFYDAVLLGPTYLELHVTGDLRNSEAVGDKAFFVMTDGSHVELFEADNSSITYDESSNTSSVMLDREVPSSMRDLVGSDSFSPKVFRVQKIVYRVFKMPDGSVAKGLWREVNDSSEGELLLEDATGFTVSYDLQVAQSSPKYADCLENAEVKWLANPNSDKSCTWNEVYAVKLLLFANKENAGLGDVTLDRSVKVDLLNYRMVMR